MIRVASPARNGRVPARHVLARFPVVAVAVLLAGCGYIVTPADESSPTPVATGSWVALATKVEAVDGGLHVDLAIRNETGDWSALQTAAGAVVLHGGDGTTTACDTAFVGTGGTRLPPGFQARGYTVGTKTEPEIQPMFVECAGAAPSPGSKLSISYTYVRGEFNYYSPSQAIGGSLEVDLDEVAADLAYPIADPVDGLIEAVGGKIVAINNAELTLSSVKRTGDELEFDWATTNPTAYQTYVHIGTPPVIGNDGIIYGLYESPHLADTPITPANGEASWTTKATAPAEVTGLYLLVSVESKQQKNFVSHVIDLTATP